MLLHQYHYGLHSVLPQTDSSQQLQPELLDRLWSFNFVHGYLFLHRSHHGPTSCSCTVQCRYSLLTWVHNIKIVEFILSQYSAHCRFSLKSVYYRVYLTCMVRSTQIPCVELDCALNLKSWLKTKCRTSYWSPDFLHAVKKWNSWHIRSSSCGSLRTRPLQDLIPRLQLQWQL